MQTDCGIHLGALKRHQDAQKMNNDKPEKEPEV
jgi:hypothetical protein